MLKDLERDFREPGAWHRGMPFWAWNGKLSPDELRRQIRLMKQHGPRRLLHALPGGPRHPVPLGRVVRLHRGVRRRGGEAGHARVAVRRGPLALGRGRRPGDEGPALAPAVARDAGARLPERAEVGRRHVAAFTARVDGHRGARRAAHPPGRAARAPRRGRDDPRLRRGGRPPVVVVQRRHLPRHAEPPGGAAVHRRHARGLPEAGGRALREGDPRHLHRRAEPRPPARHRPRHRQAPRPAVDRGAARGVPQALRLRPAAAPRRAVPRRGRPAVHARRAGTSTTASRTSSSTRSAGRSGSGAGRTACSSPATC